MTFAFVFYIGCLAGGMSELCHKCMTYVLYIRRKANFASSFCQKVLSGRWNRVSHTNCRGVTADCGAVEIGL